MNDVIAAIERHLQRKLTAAQLDYYQVLGLELYCNDTARIRTSLQSAMETFKQSQPDKHPESSQLVGKLLKQAQVILLDPSKKPSYDKQLAKLLASPPHRAAQTASTPAMKPTPAVNAAPAMKPASAVKPTPAMPESPAAASPHQPESFVLPAGEPMAPYSWASAEPLSPSNASATAVLESVLDVATRRSQLLELFPSLALIEAAPSQATATANTAWQPSPSAPRSNPTARRPNGLDAERGENLVDQLKRRRLRRSRLGVGGMIVGASLLLGFASFQFFTNRNRLADREQQAKNNSTKSLKDAASNPAGNSTLAATDPKSQGTQSLKEPVRSNLPSVRRDDANSDGTGSMSPGAMAGTPTDVVATAPTNPPPPESTPNPEAPPTPPPETTPAPAMAESKAWSDHMNQARTAIDALDFERFHQSIEQALQTATTPGGKAKAARLDQIGQLYQIYTEAFAEAKKKARGTSSIKAGTSEFIVVEATPEKLIVKAQGKNQTYEWPKLPFGMAVAISDLGLSTEEPNDLAARAVFFSLDPNYREAAKSNDIVQKRIESWFEKSLGKGSVRADLKQGLEDKYE
jgi:cytoskeletal protein RodZ